MTPAPYTPKDPTARDCVELAEAILIELRTAVQNDQKYKAALADSNGRKDANNIAGRQHKETKS